MSKKTTTTQDDFVDFEDEPATKGQTKTESKNGQQGYVSINTSGFKDFLLKPELLRAVTDCGFEHPSEGTFRKP